MDPNHFLGKPEEYRAWAKANPRWNPSMCARHWEPCPVEGLNGILVSIRVQQIALEELFPADVLKAGPPAMNSWQENRIVPFCCELGDERMAALWDEARALP